MNSFDHIKAWHEYIYPEFVRIYPHIQKAYHLTELHADKMSQVRATAEISGVPEEVFEEFRKLDPKILAHAAVIVYYLGHCSPTQMAQKHGLYWKFGYIADAIIIEKNASSLLLEEMTNVEDKLDEYIERIFNIEDYYRELKL